MRAATAQDACNPADIRRGNRQSNVVLSGQNNVRAKAGITLEEPEKCRKSLFSVRIFSDLHYIKGCL